MRAGIHRSGARARLLGIAARAAFATGLAASVLALAACALPHVTQRPAQVEYRLLSPALQQPAPGLRPLVVRMVGIEAAPGLGGVDMLYSPSPLQLMAYRDSRWVVPPAAMIDSALRRTLARQPWIAAVEGTAAVAPADGSLSCRLELLEHDVYARQVRMALRCQWFRQDVGQAGERLGAAWSFDAEQPAPTQDAAGYAQAAQQLLDGAVAQALRHIALAVQTPPQHSSPQPSPSVPAPQPASH